MNLKSPESYSGRDMHFAEYIYNIAPLKTLLESGRDVNVTNYRGESILIESVKFNRLEHVKLLMEYNANINVIDDKKDTPLLAACRSGHSECLEQLFSNPESKPDVNSVDSADESGAMLASKNGHVNCLNILLRNEEIDLTKTNERGENALMLATEWNHIECAKILLEHGADPSAKTMGGRTALHIACAQDHAEIVELLIDHKANVDSLQLGGLTPLMCAVLKNNVQCVQHLLEANADGNLADNEAVTPAIMASVKGSTESLELLLEAGVDINTCDIYFVNALTHAIRMKNWKCVDLLIAYGAFVGSIFNVHILCGEDSERCAKLTELIFAAGGHNHVGEEDVIAHAKRVSEKEEREKFQKSNTLPLFFLCKEYIKNGFKKKYPGTNLFPLVESLPVPVGFKRSVLNGVKLDVKVPLEKAVKCTSYEFRPHICSMCLRSEAELRVENLELELCRCRVIGYCSERCDSNHWVMAHMATCEKDRRSWSFGPICAWCARPCTRHNDEEFVSCMTCERVVYCSTICRTADWISVHKTYCFQRRPTSMYDNLI